jgi:hypothetical protein
MPRLRAEGLLEDAEHHVRLEEDALACVKPELVEVLRLVRDVTDSMSTTLSSLAADPAQYGAVRDELDRLDRERR